MSAVVEPLSMQRYFAETVDYLRRQERRSVMDDFGDEVCVYRAADGNRCAVGYWIPDDVTLASQNASLHYLINMHPELWGVAWPDDPQGVDLASELQQLHDSESSRLPTGGGLSRTGEKRASRIADKFGVTYTGPQS